MSNGGGPPVFILANSDYQTIKGGSDVSRGTYAGCILVGLTYYWVSAPDSGDYWNLNTGIPDATQKNITSSVWNKCEDGGDYNWSVKGERWNDPIGGEDYRWGHLGGDVVLVEI